MVEPLRLSLRELWRDAWSVPRRFASYVLRSCLRARVRTALTLLGAALAVGLFAFVQVVDGGVRAIVKAAGDEVLVVFQDSRFCPLTSELPARYAKPIRAIDGVKSVLPTLVYVNSCRSNLDLVTLHGVDADALADVHAFDVVAGDVATFGGRPDAALVGTRLAERRKLQVGDRLRLGLVDVQVAGIVHGRSADVDNVAFVHLDQLSLARDLQGQATQFFVRLDEGADPAAVAAEIDATFRPDEARTDTKTLQAFVAGAVSEVAELVGFGRIAALLAVFVMALLLANTVFISLESRAGEMGTLETIGVGRASLFVLVLGEGALLAVLGGAAGAGAVMALLAVHPLTLGIEGHGIDFTPGLAPFLGSVAVAALLGVLAAVPPALAVVRRPLALAIKAE